ncbi:helix-turn-helix transcriptional regulator [Sanyastnella coralliicola]|uniref:helix-turn-helix transcriptional regulator n=1 Tax=Sanyastnella coralliicola TaxID=3069118 RepID=UPI0027BAD035|nr:WYL domain-containing protein [Longitalea sp. SCSIO 12813]
MPANKYALLRYRIIDRCISNSARPYPSKEDLREACEEALYGSSGDRISISTIEKDLWAMRNEGELGYYAPIAYSKVHKGYFYEEEDYSINEMSLNDDDLEAIHFAAETFNQFRDIPIFKQYQQAIDKVTSRLKISPDLNDQSSEHFIQFEEAPEVKGIEHLGPIAKAIQQHQRLRFQYAKFTDDTASSYEVEPYLLKEYRNRWYVICWNPSREDFRTYALDRMGEVKVSKKTFKPDPEFSSDRFFQHSIGITEVDKEPQQVIFECSPVLGRYLDSQPLHRSQNIAWSEDKAQIKLEVLITYELIAELLSFGADVKVLAPTQLKDRIQSTLSAALSKY